MAVVNILRLNINNVRTSIDQRYLFACAEPGFHCWVAEISSFGISDNVAKRTNRHDLIYMLDELEENTHFKFDDIYAGKGLFKSLFDKSFLISFNNTGKTYLFCLSHLRAQPTKKLTFTMDGYSLSLFLQCLTSSQKYVELVTNYLSTSTFLLSKFQEEKVRVMMSDFLVNLKQPERHMMDLTWAKLACTAVHELRQLHYAMSWLSTIGGAFSALGEEQERCAKNAGMISIEQLRIALRLGDKIIIAQCKLYFSLSLIQRGYCQLAKKLIKEQYNAVKSGPVVDKKTLNMCKGIWARLKYEINVRKNAKGKFSQNLSR